ncbi:MAG TPA: hypothetical protein VFS18_00460 [Actinomycetota bacterium]|nr:hypothetical protein [Actinomycetota bacterium]
MTASTIAIVVAGIVASVLAGIALGMDVTALVILALIVGCGLVAVRVALKARAGDAGPVQCPHCSGLLSPNAPYCKHCGMDL